MKNYVPESRHPAVTDYNLEASAIALLKGLVKLLQTTAFPVDIQYAAVKAEKRAATSRAIRDTNKAWLLTQQDWSMYERVVLLVSNTHDQPVKLFLSLQNVGDFMKLDGTRQEIEIPAGADRAIVTAEDWPVLGETIVDTIAFGAQADIAPTSGEISVTFYLIPRV